MSLTYTMIRKAIQMCVFVNHSLHLNWNISDGYTTSDVQYIWANQTHPVKKYKDITMAQFKLTHIEHGSKTMGENHGE